MLPIDIWIKKLNNLFCVISAIGNGYGVFTYKQRLEQLISTIESIKIRAPNSDIVIYDASEDSLPSEDISLLSSMVNKLVLLADDKYINFLKYKSLDPSPNKFEKKTVGEIQAMCWFLTDLKSSGKQYNRVFKLSGRYQLSKNFNLDFYDDKSNQCIMLNKEDWYGKHVFTLRLWSFDFKQLDSIVKLFQTMQSHTYSTVTDTQKLEIVEYTFTKFLEDMRILYITVDKIGVKGLMGLAGHFIDQ